MQNIGFDRTNIEYEARVRVAGESKYSIKKLFAFSINTIMCFSNLPLKLGIYAGCGAGILGILMMAYTIWSWARVGTPSGMLRSSTDLFHVCGSVLNYRSHRKLHCHLVCRIKRQTHLYCERNRES